MISKHTRQHRPKSRRNSPGSTNEPLILPPFPRADQVPNEDYYQRRDPARADPLHHPGGDQHRDVLRRAAQRAPGHEDGDSRNKGPLAPKHLGRLAKQRHHHRLRQRVPGPDPRVPGVGRRPAQAGHDLGQRGGHDGLVQRREEEGQEHAADQDDVADLGQAMAVGLVVFLWGFLGCQGAACAF